MNGIYFGGTGNTKHCIETFLTELGGKTVLNSIEDFNPQDFDDNVPIVIAYPVYYSNIPKILADFLLKNKKNFNKKKVYIIATMALFSGDGTGCCARLLEKYGATVIGGIHLIMPDCIGDVRVLKRKAESYKKTIIKADQKIVSEVEKIKKGQASQQGLGMISRFLGFIVQRLWFAKYTDRYHKQPKVSNDKCIGCSKCISVCPMQNFVLADKKAVSKNKCTLCYRCYVNCPTKALTILGRTVHQQYRIEDII